jgi:type IV pilus assembly protein PilY1
MNMKKFLVWILVVSLIGGNYLPAALADDSDIFGANVNPNVMIGMTSAMTMGDPILSEAYAPSTTYNTPLTYVSAKVYKFLDSTPGCKAVGQTRPCYVVYKDTIGEVADSGAQTALSAVGYWNGSIGGSAVSLYTGNYLNYTLCTTCGTSQSKISLAKTVLSNLITNTNGIRFGALKYAAGGGIVMEPIRDMTAANKATLVTAIQNMPLDSAGNPIGPQIQHAADYYNGNLTGYSSPIQYECQPNFLILITDGKSTGTDPVTQAEIIYTTDYSTMPGMQNVIVHVVAFALADDADKPAEIQKLKEVAAKGGGSFYQAETAGELEKVLLNAINQILAATFSFATPTIPTTGTSGATRAYLASFQSNASRPFWNGYLKAYDFVNGTIPTDPVTNLPSGAPVWDAGKQLSDQASPVKSAGSRNITTYTGGALQNFTTGNAAITTAMLAAADSTERGQIINFIRGAVDYLDDDLDNSTGEERPWKLGDIFHSTPVVVSPPFFPFITDSTYSAFKTANASRTTILLAGANDGMVHAFRESDGEELWAFIPPNLLDQLKNLKVLAGSRDYYVDASPIAADVKTGGVWKTIAIFGQRRGGSRYYALDITDTTNPQYLWSFSDARLGETWSEPAIGKVKMSDGTDKWVAFVGGGFDTTNANYSSGNKTTEAFFAIDLSNGAKLWEYYNDGTTDDRQFMNFSFPAAPTAVDLDNNGYIDRVYIGDVGGQVWKFDVAPTGGTTLSGSLINNWTGKRLFAAAPTQANPPAAGEFYPTQAIYAWPALAFDASKNLWVFFGTGDRFHPNSASTNRFYGIKDNTGMTNGSALTESSLTDMSSGGTPTITQGWYLVFSPANSGEKVLAAAEVFRGVVLFTTFTPVTTVACGTGGGNAKLYSADMDSGDAAINLLTATDLADGQSVLSNSKGVGTGIPSKPVLVGGHAFTSTTSEMIFDTDTGKGPRKTLVGWREVFQ